MDTIRIGCHLSPSGGLLAMCETAKSLRCGTFQFFLRNPRGSKAKPFDEKDADKAVSFLKEKDMFPVLMHAPYTLNPCSADPHVREFAGMVFKEDIERGGSFSGCYYNFHPGSHVGAGTQEGIRLTGEMLSSLTEDPRTALLIETMSGQGSEIGKTFEEVKELIERSEKKNIGVCLDTCHVYQAGYDIVNDPEGVLEAFDRIIGLERLRFLHINDSMFGLGAHKDRHAPIGKGCIGFEALYAFTHHPKLIGIPMVLETPHEKLSEYTEEIISLQTGEYHG